MADIINVSELAEWAAKQATDETVAIKMEEQIKIGLEQNLAPIRSQLESAITSLINQYEIYSQNSQKYKKMLGARQNLELLRDMVYTRFFKVQNLINEILGQKIVMTYVHIGEDGTRQIFISENTIEHLQPSKLKNGAIKLSYLIDQSMEKLQSSLSDKDSSRLEDTAREVTRRYNTFRYDRGTHLVLWNVGEWRGVKLYTMGPINEAYVNLQLNGSGLFTDDLENNIDMFMLGKYGAIQADATRGFAIGDVSHNGVQYAVKGEFASPQGFKEVIKQLRILKDANFSNDAFYNFLKRYTVDELQKKYKPQIKALTASDMKKVSTQLEKSITKKQITVGMAF